MSSIFTPKRVPGLLTDDEMALGMKEYAEQQKSTMRAAPPSTGAVEFAGTIMGNAANDLKRTVQSAPSPGPVPLTGVETAGAGGLRVDPAEAAQRPAAGLLGTAGMLEPGGEEQAAEHDILMRDAATLVRAEEDVAGLREGLAAGRGAPIATDDPAERQWQLEQRLKEAAERRRPLAEAQADLATVVATPPTQTWWRNAVDVGVRGFALTGTSVPQWWLDLGENAIWAATGANVSNNPASAWFDGVDKSITAMLPGDKARSQEFVSQLAAGSGSMTAFLIAGYVGSVFGAPAGVAAGLTGGMSTGNQLYEESQQFKATGLQKFLSFFGGTFLGLSEGIPIEGAISRALPYDRAFFQANRESKGQLLRMLNNTTASSLEEFIQEFGQAAGEDLIAKFAFDPDRELDVLDWAKQGAVGFVIGAGMGTAASVLGETGVLKAEQVSRIDPAQQQKIAETVLAQGKTQLNSILGREPEARTAAEPEGGVATAPEGSAVTTVEGVSSVPTRATAPRPVVHDAVRDIVDTAALAQEQLDIAAQVGAEVELAEGVKVQVAPAVETPEFKKWFGASKVVDEAGAPLRVFHGAFRSFSAFDPRRAGERDGGFFGRGFYFTPDKAQAEEYAESPPESEVDDATPNIVEAYVALQNPFVWDTSTPEAAEATRAALATFGVVKTDAFQRGAGLLSHQVAAFNRAARAAGHDGVIVREGIFADEGVTVPAITEVVAFEPTQIKSATSNSGAFDPNDPNIDRQMAPPDPNIAATIKAIAANLEPSETQPLPAIEKGLTGPIPIVVAAARAYADAAGIPHRRARSYVKVDVSRAKRIAQAYADMKHEPDDPTVQAAYRAMAEEVEAQYVYALAAGADLSPNPAAPQYPTGHLMAPFAEKFWALHRYFGTGLEGATDAENMWQAHSRLFSATAVPAMTTETRVGDAAAERRVGIMPSWTWQEGVEESSAYDLDAPIEYMLSPAEEPIDYQALTADEKAIEARVDAELPELDFGALVADSAEYLEAFAAQVQAADAFAAAKGAIWDALNAAASARLNARAELRARLRASDDAARANAFYSAISLAKSKSPWGAKVHVYSRDQYGQMRLFLAPDHLSGFALKGEDIVSVFIHPASGGGRLDKIIDTAIANGGRTLDAFDGKLVDMYAARGFKEVSREPWNEEFKPEGWQDEWGTPDVVFMAFVGADQRASVGTSAAAFEAWDDGAAIRNEEPGGEGELTLLYSGAPRDFRRATRAMWLTPDRRTADDFARERGLAEFDEDGNNIGGGVFTYYARMENPFEYDWGENSWRRGPETEYPTIYTVDGERYSDRAEAERALEELKESRAQEASDERERDIDERIFVRGGPLFGGKFEVVLRSDAPSTGELEGRIANVQLQIDDQNAILATERARPPETTTTGTLKYYEEYVARNIAAYQKTKAELQAQLDATRANPPQDEVLASFETEDEAQDFILEYTTQQMQLAADEARDDFDVKIEEETDYEIDEGQTTDDVVQQARYGGYDGVIFRNVDEGNGPVDVYVIIEPGNAKSTANLGTWNRDDPDILRMVAGTSFSRKPYAMEPTRPAAGIPEADPDAVPVDTTLAGISKDFTDLFDLTVRQKVTARGKDANRVMGEYNRRQATVRLRTWNDLSTLVHEGGHAFNDVIADDPAWRQFLANNRKSLLKASKLYQGDLSKATSDVKQREGFAEFFRVYALTPQYARKHFPQLTAAFEAQLKTYDQRLLDGLGAVATQFEAWLHMPSTSLLSGMVVSGYRHTGIGAAIKELREAGVTTWMHEVATRNASWAINRFASVNLLVDQLLQLGEANRGQPLDLTRADDPRVQVRLAGNTDRRAQQSVTGGVLGYRSLDSTSRGLQDVLLRSQDQPLNQTPRGFDEERHKDFGGYLVARRALAEYERYEQGELTRPPIDATKGEVIRAIKDYEAKYGNSFTEAAQWAHEYGMALWQLRYDAGLLDRETYEEGRKRAFYAPLQRDVSDKKGGFSRSSLTSGDRLTKGPRFRGSSRQVIDPMAVLMEMTFAVEKQIAQNDAKKYLARLADRAGKAGALVERVPATQLVGTPLNARQVAAKLLGDDSISDIDAADMMAVLMATYEKDDAITLFRSEQAASVGQNALFFWEDGKMAAILVKDGDIGRDIVETMNAVGRENMDLISTTIATTSSVVRNAITLWPDFLIMNFLRDQPAAWILTEGYVPFWGALRGGFDEVTQKQIAKSYNASRGALGGMVNATLHVERVNRDIRTLAAKGYVAQAFGDVQHGWDIPGVVRGLSRFTELAETGTRLGVYRATYNRAIKEGLAPYEAGVEAAYIATDLMDFGLNGSKMLTTRRLIPFLNAQLQGLYKLYRTLGADEVSRRRGMRFVLRAYIKGVKGMQLSRVEEQHIRVGRKAWIKMVALGVISAALHLLYEDDPDYQEASEYMRATGWVIPTGTPGEIFYFPKPFELAIFANATERLLEFAGGDAQAPGRFLRGLVLNMSPPTDVPLLELGYSLATNTDIFTGAPVVPEHMKGFAPYLQYDRYTSNIAKWLAGMTGQSPMVVDHMMSSLFAGAYRDVARVVDAMDPARPAAQIDDAPITRRLVRDARRGGTALTDFYAQASARSSVLSRALSAYKQEIDAGNEVAANENLSRMTDDEKAYALLMTHYDDDNKRLHPFYRANQVVTVVNKMRREIASSLSLADTTDPDDPLPIRLSAKQKAELDDMLSEVIRREVRNTMISTGQAGWTGKELLPLDQTLDILAAFSPDTFYELERRYAKAKIYDAESVAEAWPEVRDRLLWDREAADLSDLVVVAREGL